MRLSDAPRVSRLLWTASPGSRSLLDNTVLDRTLDGPEQFAILLIYKHFPCGSRNAVAYFDTACWRENQTAGEAAVPVEEGCAGRAYPC
jgi:hypothetical protein